jgi:hypothetical protein
MMIFTELYINLAYLVGRFGGLAALQESSFLAVVAGKAGKNHQKNGDLGRLRLPNPLRRVYPVSNRLYRPNSTYIISKNVCRCKIRT